MSSSSEAISAPSGVVAYQRQDSSSDSSYMSGATTRETIRVFGPVLEALDEDGLLSLAKLAHRDHTAGRPKKWCGCGRDSTQCEKMPVFGDHMRGSYNLVLPIDFCDGDRWMAKIPCNGTKGQWDDLSKRAMCSEVETMGFVRERTSIPVPEVFAYISTPDNAAGVPFILMSRLPGVPMHKMWHKRVANKEDEERRREKRILALEGIASAMVQLDRLSFSQGGAPAHFYSRFITEVGPARLVDYNRMYDRDFRTMFDRNFSNVSEDDLGQPLFSHHEAIYTEQETTACPKKWYEAPLDANPPGPPSCEGIVQLLRWMIQWMPEPAGYSEAFVLAHPDLDQQNVLVDENGEVTGIIDWETVCTVPRSMGNRCYPRFLMADWNGPAEGFYVEEVTSPGEPRPFESMEDSPEALRDYRLTYRSMLLWKEPDPRARGDRELTRKSLISSCLYDAAVDPVVRTPIVCRMLEASFALLQSGNDLDPITLPDLCGHGKLREDSGPIMLFKEGFLRLLEQVV